MFFVGFPISVISMLCSLGLGGTMIWMVVDSSLDSEGDDSSLAVWLLDSSLDMEVGDSSFS